MTITIQKEFFTRPLIEEMEPIIEEHWTEVEKFEDIEMDVDWPSYQALQEAGAFHFYTLRIDGELIGYIGYLVSHSLHYKTHKFALCDLIYIKPESRGKMLANKLLRAAEQDLKEMGILYLGQATKLGHDFSPILIRDGYHLDEYYYTKRIQ